MKCRLLTEKELSSAEDARFALAKSRGDDKQWLADNKSTYGWASLSEILGPGVMWYCPWYFDPKDPKDQPTRERCLATYKENKNARTFLSRHYWFDWSDKRPPITVLTPNGKEWCVDQISSNGDGWTVTGDPPNITCSPSISVPGYHGFLRNGEFSPPI